MQHGNAVGVLGELGRRLDVRVAQQVDEPGWPLRLELDLEDGPREMVYGATEPGERVAATRGAHRHAGIQRESHPGVFGRALVGPAEVLHVHGWTQVVARDEGAQLSAVEKVRTALQSLRVKDTDTIESPILGAEGNREFLLYGQS